VNNASEVDRQQVCSTTFTVLHDVKINRQHLKSEFHGIPGQARPSAKRVGNGVADRLETVEDGF